MEAPVTKGRGGGLTAVLGIANVCSLLAALNLFSDLHPSDRITPRRGCALTLLGMVYFATLFELLNILALASTLRQKYQLSSGDVFDINNKVVSAVQAVFSCMTGVTVCMWSCARDFARSSHFVSEGYAWFGAAYFFYDIWSMYMPPECLALGVVSAVQAVFSCMTGVTVCMWSCARDFARSSHFVSEGYAWFGAAYFFYDIWSMYMVHVQMTTGDAKGKRKTKNGSITSLPIKEAPSFFAYCKHEPVILMHHLFIGGFGFLVIVYLRGNLGDCVFGFVYLMELSTPFVSLRGILSRLKMKSTRIYLVNGIVMLLTFFVCRVVSLPYVCYMYSQVMGMSYFEAIESLPRGCKVSILILLLPQMYWFYLMSAGAVKVFTAPAQKRS